MRISISASHVLHVDAPIPFILCIISSCLIARFAFNVLNRVIKWEEGTYCRPEDELALLGVVYSVPVFFSSFDACDT